MRIRIDGGGAEQTQRIAAALIAGGFRISGQDDGCDLVLTVGEALPTRLSLGDLEIDFALRQVRRGDQVIWLTPGEFGLLGYLARAGRTMSRTEMLRDLWGIRFDPQTNSVAVHVSRLRRKIGRSAILTEAGGYRIGVPGPG